MTKRPTKRQIKVEELASHLYFFLNERNLRHGRWGADVMFSQLPECDDIKSKYRWMADRLLRNGLNLNKLIGRIKNDRKD